MSKKNMNLSNNMKLSNQNDTSNAVQLVYVVTRNATPVVTFKEKSRADAFVEKLKDDPACYYVEMTVFHD